LLAFLPGLVRFLFLTLCGLVLLTFICLVFTATNRGLFEEIDLFYGLVELHSLVGTAILCLALRIFEDTIDFLAGLRFFRCSFSFRGPLGVLLDLSFSKGHLASCGLRWLFFLGLI